VASVEKISFKERGNAVLQPRSSFVSIAMNDVDSDRMITESQADGDLGVGHLAGSFPLTVPPVTSWGKTRR
jgi:hypothetical protein